jgi:hypothetical protein
MWVKGSWKKSFVHDLTFDPVQVRTAEASASGRRVCQSQQDVSALARAESTWAIAPEISRVASPHFSATYTHNDDAPALLAALLVRCLVRCAA